METITLSRSFSIKDRQTKETLILPDPNPNYSLEEVLSHYAGSYPELGNAIVTRNPKIDSESGDVLGYELKSTLDTKG